MAFHSLKTFFSERQNSKLAPTIKSDISLKLPSEDSSDTIHTSEDEIHTSSKDIGYAEGQSFIIEYIDSKKNLSTRRITVWGIKLGPSGTPILIAKCHERNATRSFRIDRIKAIADFDGELASSVSKFLTENFEMHPELAALAELHSATGGAKRASSSKNKSKPKPDVKMQAIKATSRKKGLHLLWCFANADDDFHHTELDTILNYCETMCELEGIISTEEELGLLGKYIKRLRPTGQTIDKSVDTLLNLSSTDIDSFLHACIQVAKADGYIHPQEIVAINTISNELVGRNIL